ncbi:MAG: Gfo/Idh/MocA family oxidoreductase [Chloroflexota bacterium]
MASVFGSTIQNPASIPIRIGYIGAGTFVRDAHIPALLELRERFDLVAVCSQTAISANARAEQWKSQTGHKPVTYTDLDGLLAQDDIDAIAIALPISLMPDVVLKALMAGKHVFSEKPIAPTTAAARTIYSLYQNYTDRVWMVGESWRYESTYHTAAKLLRSEPIGATRFCQFSLYLPVTPDSKYWKTQWRRNWEFDGGWILDGGVHHIAVLRAAMGEIRRVHAFTALNNPELGKADTLSASLEFESGAIGTYAATYALHSNQPPALTISGDEGCMHITRGQIEIVQDENTRSIECPKFDGVTRELFAFADAIEFGRPHLNTPEEGLRDVAVIEAMLDSARLGQALLPDFRLFEERGGRV